MWWIAIMSAFGSEPELSNLDSGGVRGRVVVTASADEVRRLLRAPNELLSVTSDSSEIQSLTQDGDCRKMTVYSRHPIMPVTYTSKDCDTPEGVVTQLLESKQLSKMDATWKVQDDPAGCVVVYDLDLKTNLPLPGFMIRRNARKAVADALEGIRAKFAAKP